MEGSTWEGTFEAQLVRKPNFTWRAGIVADRNRNKITEFNRPCYTTNTIAYRCAGETLGNMYGFRFVKDVNELPADAQARASEFQKNDEGLLVYVGEGNSYTSGLWANPAVQIGNASYRFGQPITQQDSTGSAAVQRMGNGNPDVRFGVSNTIGWRSVQLFMLWDAQVGGDVYNQTRQRMYQWGRHGDVDQAGKEQGLKKPTDYYVNLYAANSPTDYFVEDASFVKLRELSLKYRLPSSFNAALARFGASQASVSLIGRNLLTFTNYKGYDPEVGSVLNRLDSFSYPRYRTVTGSFEIIF